MMVPSCTLPCNDCSLDSGISVSKSSWAISSNMVRLSTFAWLKRCRKHACPQTMTHCTAMICKGKL